MTMDDLISRKALDDAFTELRWNEDGTLNHFGDRPDWCMHGSEVDKLIKNAPSVPTVPIKAISVWLAAYAAPPKYALDEIAGTDPGRIVTVDTLVRAWEYHWKNLMECGLIREGLDAEAEK